MRVLVVGAGPTGLCAALELARRGVESLVVERRSSASTLSRAVGITPRSLHLLESSGVTERWIEAGVRFEGARLYRGSELLLDLPFEIESPRYGYGFILGLAQDRTEAHLAESYRERGGELRYGEELIDLEIRDDAVIGRFSSGREEPFDYVVGADGVESGVRCRAGISFDGFDLPETWSIADVEAGDWQNPRHFTTCLLDGDVVVVAPLEARRFRLVSSTEDALSALPLELDPTGVRRRDTFRISVRLASRFRSGRIFLAGDAAHCHSPVGGRGMNLGLADAVAVAEAIATGALGGYEEPRRRDAKRTLAGSERFRRFAVNPSPFARWAANNGLRLIGRSDFLKRGLATFALYA